MSDSKRATLITVGATKSEKNKVNKTVRLTINLDESNESKYPELNYKELLIAEDRKKKVENGKTNNDGLNPFSDNDDDVERVARKFEQKYGGKSTYGRKGRTKHDEFADIGAGYDENDSFIDNTDGYDEMIPPECDTLYGGFYINSGSLEFKNVDNAQSDDEPRGGRRNKRRLSSSSSEEGSSDSSSGSESLDEKDPKNMLNGDVNSHKTEHRKKKTKKIENSKPKKVRRTDSSAATSGKFTSDDNNHADAESADSRTSQSDSVTSKPAPSSENAITSDSSRDVEAKEGKLPPQVGSVLEELEAAVRSLRGDKSAAAAGRDVEARTDSYILKLERSLARCNVERGGRRAAWSRVARCLNTSRTKLLHKVKSLAASSEASTENVVTTSTALPTAAVVTATAPSNNKREIDQEIEDLNAGLLSDEEREAKIVDTLHRLKMLIEECKPGMMASYNAECKRVQEERKKIQIASAADGAPVVEKRLPKRRFPWCPRTRALLARLVLLAGTTGGQEAAAMLLAKRALPLFPSGFVRMPTLLRQADLSKELKVTEMKRQRLGSSSQPAQPQPITPLPIQFPEPIQFPSSLTVTTMKPSPDKHENNIISTDKDKQKPTSIFGKIISSFSLSKDLVVEKQDDRKKETIEKKDDLYIPPNNIGCITITPVVNSKEKKVNNTISDKQKESLIRVKSPAALNDMVNKQEKVKALENIHKRDKHKKEKSQNVVKEKNFDTPLHVDTSYQPKQKEPTPSPKNKDEVTLKQIETMRVAENNIPRPGLVPVSNSPTFAKPDKRPPEVKKKKEILIVSDVDPLAEVQNEPLTVDDSSSDVELVEDNKSDKSDSVPSKDNVSVREVNHKNDNPNRKDGEKQSDKLDEATKEDFDSVMKNLRDLEHSQEAPKFNSSSYGGVIASAKREKSSSQFNSRSSIFGESRSDKDKLTSFFEQNGWM